MHLLFSLLIFSYLLHSIFGNISTNLKEEAQLKADQDSATQAEDTPKRQKWEYNEAINQKFQSRILAESSSSILVNPLKSGMYPTPVNIPRIQTSYEEAQAVFEVPRQSVVKITIDLRHLTNYTTSTSDSISFEYGQKGWEIVIYTIDYGSNYFDNTLADVLALPYLFTRNTTAKINTHLFPIFAYKDMYLMVYLRINNKTFFNLRSLLAQTSSVEISTPNRAVIGENKAFAFVINNNQLVNLPVALPVLNSDNSYPDAIMTYTPLDENTLTQLNITQDDTVQKYLVNNDKYWKTLEQLTFPFIPFVSNCVNYGDFIYLHEVIEDPKLCDLVPPSETIPVSPFGFLQAPTADKCEEVAFTCILDDAFFTSTQFSKFYEQAIQAELFYITSDPIDMQVSLIQQSQIFESTSLIPVLAMNSIQSTQLPKEITLDIEYYQVDRFRKRIIKAGMVFGQLIDKTNVNSTNPFTYKFKLNFISLNHAELAISFAFGIPVYIILSFIIGMFSIIMIFFYYCFFRTSNIREVEFKKPLFVTRQSMKRALHDLYEFLQFYKPISIGIILGFIPNFFLLFLVSFCMLGGFWGYPYFSCTDLNTEKICETSIFESFGADQVTQQLRRGRLGVTLLVIGFYALVRISAVYLPLNQKEKSQEAIKSYKSAQSNKKPNKFVNAVLQLEEKEDLLMTESFDGNFWQDKIWTRGLYIYITILVIIIYVAVLFLSFSTFYGANIWFFTFILKISQLIIGELLKIYIENELLLSTLGAVMAMSGSVSGLGAIDFFDYLFNTFINLGISTFEKTSQVIVVDLCAEYVIENQEKFQNYIAKIFQSHEQEEEADQSEENKKDDFIRNKDNDGDNSQLTQNNEGNSSIFLTENCEESMMSIDFQEDQDSRNHNYEDEKRQQQRQRLSKMSITVIDDLRTNNNLEQRRQSKKFRTSLKQIESKQEVQNIIEEEEDLNQEEYIKDSLELAFDQLLNKKFTKNPTALNVRQQTKGKSADEETLFKKHSVTLKMFSDFCNSTFTLIATPCQVVCLWMFFDANNMFTKWGITKKGIVYYYLFNVLNVPFTMMVDILLLKTNEQFHDVNVREYYFFVSERFKSRSLTWQADHEETDELTNYLEQDLKSIHKWCFSSQLFFCLFIFVAGAIAIIEGVIIISFQQYNLFSDSSSLFYICIFWLPVCFLIDFVCVNTFCERIWGLKEEPEESIVVKNPNLNIQSNLPSPRSSYNFSKGIISHYASLKVAQGQVSEKTPQLQGTDHVINNNNLQNIFSQDQLIPSSQMQLQNEDNFLLNLHQQSSRFGQSLTKNIATLQQSKFKSKEPTSNIMKSITFQNTIPQDFYHLLSQMQSEDCLADEMLEFKNSLDHNRYLRLYFEEQIEQLQDYDISVHQFILSYTEKSEEDREKLFRLFLHNFKRFKIQKDPYDQLQKLRKIDFQKAIFEKEKKSKQQDVKSHFLEHEYKDQKFLKKFLQINKIWLRRNMKLFFDDLINGESKKELNRLREPILESFGSIYGELKIEGISQEIKVKEVFKQYEQPSKQDIQQQSESSLHHILRYWIRRNMILKHAEQLIGGYFLKGIVQQSCYYCRSNWGLTIQILNSNIEDLFQQFYKRECRRSKIIFNVLELLENQRIISSPYMQYFTRFPSSNNNNPPQQFAFYNQEEQLDHFSSPPRSFREDYESENEQGNSSQDNDDYDMPSKKRQDEERKILQNPYLFRQRFIDRWQEYFFSHAQNIAICFDCNDKAQEIYLNKIQSERKRREFEEQQLRNTVISQRNVRNTYLQRKPTLDIDEIEGGQKKDAQHGFLISPYNIKRGGDNIVNSNQIIQEEYNEDQSQNEDKLSQFNEDSFELNGERVAIKQQPTQQSKSQQSAHTKKDELFARKEEKEVEEIENQEEDDDDYYLNLRRQSQKLNQSQRSIKSENRTHPINITQENGSMADKDEIKNMNEQIQEENNRSFKVVSARRNSVAYFEDFTDYDQGTTNRKVNKEDNSDVSSENANEEEHQMSQHRQFEQSDSSRESDHILHVPPNSLKLNPYNLYQSKTTKSLNNMLKGEMILQLEPTNKKTNSKYNTYTLNEEDEIEENRQSTEQNQITDRSLQYSSTKKL